MIIALLTLKPLRMYAENEISLRFKAAFENMGAKIFLLDPEYKDVLTGTPFYDFSKLDFVISLHVTIPRPLAVPSYLCVWDPFSWLNTEKNLKNLLQYDDYLIIDAPDIKQNLQELLSIIIGKNIFNFNFLPPTLSKSTIILPTYPYIRKIFYCGMGADHVNTINPRLGRALKILDSKNILDIYGPQKILASDGKMVAPWGSYCSYRGEAPFDGHSLIRRMSLSGISLVVSSLAHRRAGVPSARIFEACASGNVIIADNNKYFDHWKDTIYRVDFNVSDKDVANQLMEHVHKINANSKQAYEMAVESQKIFIEHYSLEQYLEKILLSHKSRDSFRTIFAESKKEKDLRKVIYSFLCFSKIYGFLPKMRFIADKYHLNFLFTLNECRKKIAALLR